MLDLAAELARLRAQHLYRGRRRLDGPQQVRPLIGGRRLLAFCSNDYLGLASHPTVIAALREGAARWGVGSGAAHLVSGHGLAHERLEQALAAFVGRERALLFSTGYMANLGAIVALAGRGDLILADRLNHASLTDGARLSGARLRRYAHGDCAQLQRLAATAAPGCTLLISTDGVFSMDGDLAPLPALVAAASARGGWLLVDDAHGLGVIGPGGRGTLAHYGLGAAEVPILIGTLGKAFGTFGAFVAGSNDLIEYLVQRARSYIYTTALPPALAHATLAALELAGCEDWRRDRLQALVARFQAGAAALGLPLIASPTPIQPLLCGDAATALAWSRALEAAGILVTAIRPPTVPAGSARLRITFSAAHDEADVDRLLEALARLPRTTAMPSADPERVLAPASATSARSADR
ncbi:MAG: 8-amino-7-oxononanoate synthase [Chromatiaceae bacterium]|nr:MAG: 8-amino-7-oxononanoate synthase [Chromatiaceae bacterium]